MSLAGIIAVEIVVKSGKSLFSSFELSKVAWGKNFTTEFNPIPVLKPYRILHSTGKCEAEPDNKLTRAISLYMVTYLYTATLYTATVCWHALILCEPCEQEQKVVWDCANASSVAEATDKSPLTHVCDRILTKTLQHADWRNDPAMNSWSLWTSHSS